MKRIILEVDEETGQVTILVPSQMTTTEASELLTMASDAARRQSVIAQTARSVTQPYLPN